MKVTRETKVMKEMRVMGMMQEHLAMRAMKAMREMREMRVMMVLQVRMLFCFLPACIGTVLARFEIQEIEWNMDQRGNWSPHTTTMVSTMHILEIQYTTSIRCQVITRWPYFVSMVSEVGRSGRPRHTEQHKSGAADTTLRSLCEQLLRRTDAIPFASTKGQLLGKKV